MERVVTVVPEDGLHARPASKFVETAGEFDCDLTVAAAANGADPVDARSMLGVTSLGVEHGDEVRLRADGAEAAEALDAVAAVLATPESECDE